MQTKAVRKAAEILNYKIFFLVFNIFYSIVIESVDDSGNDKSI